MTLMVIASIEVIGFSILVYLLTSRTRGDAALRWKAATIFSVFSGISVCLLFIFTGLFTDVFDPDFFLEGILLVLSCFVLPLMCAVLISVFSGNFGSGFALVDLFWLDPRIHYKEGKKPPFLARYFQKWFEASYNTK
jgi:hypothetical protein